MKKIVYQSLIFSLVVLATILFFSTKVSYADTNTTPANNQTTQATSIIAPILSVYIPGFTKFSDVTCDSTSPNCSIPWIAEYIGAIFKYSMLIVGILAVIVMIIGGVIWLTAGGSQGRISEGKDFVKNGVLGAVIALCSYMAMFIINPNLTILPPINVGYINKIDVEELTPDEQISAQNISGTIGDTKFGTGTNGVPLIMQCQEPARSITYGKGCSSTLCSSGCGAVSTSMAIMFFKKDAKLNDIVHELENNGGRSGCGGGTSQSGIKKVAEKYGLKTQQNNSGYDWAADKAKTCPVVISVHNEPACGTDKTCQANRKCPFTGNQHFIVITGNNNGILSINDPAHGGSTISLSDLKAKCVYGTGATQICQ